MRQCDKWPIVNALIHSDQLLWTQSLEAPSLSAKRSSLVTEGLPLHTKWFCVHRQAQLIWHIARLKAEDNKTPGDIENNNNINTLRLMILIWLDDDGYSTQGWLRESAESPHWSVGYRSSPHFFQFLCRPNRSAMNWLSLENRLTALERMRNGKGMCMQLGLC